MHGVVRWWRNKVGSTGLSSSEIQKAILDQASIRCEQSGESFALFSMGELMALVMPGDWTRLAFVISAMRECGLMNREDAYDHAVTKACGFVHEAEVPLYRVAPGGGLKCAE